MSDESQAEFFNLAEALGADAGISTQCFSVYVPDKDKNGNAIGNQRQWVLEARKLLSMINGGASIMPPIEGGWMNDEGVLICENPVIVYSQIRIELFVANLPKVREFLHRMGRETNQKVRSFLNSISDFIEFGLLIQFEGDRHDKETRRYRPGDAENSRHRSGHATNRTDSNCRSSRRRGSLGRKRDGRKSVHSLRRACRDLSASPIERRPACPGRNDAGTKIPVSDQEWHDLEAIAAAGAAEGCTPSAGQIASVLLNLALQSVLNDLAAKPTPTKEQLRQRLAQSATKS